MESRGLASAIARRLERGVDRAPFRWASRAWQRIADAGCARAVALPDGMHVVAVGGATLGGAGKTPLAVELTRQLAQDGLDCALIGHGYRARPGRARVVAPFDHVEEVGDDTLFAARELAPLPVFVAPRRADALALASRMGVSVAVVDGLLQASPRRVACSVLVLDGDRPWGSGACPPAGDLRASPEALLACADLIAVVRSSPSSDRIETPPWIRVPSRSTLPLEVFRGQRVGVLVAVARPLRIVASLRALGVDPDPVITLADHAAPGPRLLAQLAAHPVDAWITTARCATKLPPSLGGRPVLALGHQLDVGELAREVRIRLFGSFGGPRAAC